MTVRLDLLGDAESVAARAALQFGAASRTVLDESTLPAAVQRLVLLRASQVNGDGYATGVWSTLAVKAGEEAVRLHLLPTWRESTVFSDAERAALELAEQGTRVADAAGGVTDAAWEEAARHFDDQQLADLVMLVSLMNATNRMALMAGRRGGA